MLNVTATCDGLAVRGLFDGDDAIVVTQGADVGTMLVGADGSSLFSQTADRSAQISVKLQHTSATHRQLLQKWKQQRAGRLIGFPFDIIEKDSGEGGTADKCFVMQAPADSKGKNAVVREWVLVTGDWTPNVTNQ
jgi:hypothetical protein